MATDVHPTAVVLRGAELDDGVRVGPFCHVAQGVKIGKDTELLAHATLFGPLRMGERNRVFSGAVLGAAPQDRSYGGEPTELVIGDENQFREHATAHRGTVKGSGVTSIGSQGLFMVGAHVAHDCVVGDRVTIANNTSLGGHVRVEDGVVFGGHVAVAPFVEIGRLAFVAGGSMVERDVPPFVIAEGNRARVRGVNHVGLDRAGVTRDARRALERAVWLLFGRAETRSEGLRVVRAELLDDPLVAELVAALEP